MSPMEFEAVIRRKVMELHPFLTHGGGADYIAVIFSMLASRARRRIGFCIRVREMKHVEEVVTTWV